MTKKVYILLMLVSLSWDCHLKKNAQICVMASNWFSRRN